MTDFIKIIDYETSVKCPIGNNKAHPMWPGNKVVLFGVAPVTRFEKDSAPIIQTSPQTEKSVNETALMVGQNVKFDALYTFRDNTWTIPTLWDTQLAEYLITGQAAKYVSLDDLTIKYRGKEFVKDSVVKEMWDRGVQTEDIPDHLLRPYLEGDLNNTREVFKAQWAICEERGILPWVMTQMDALRATTYMARVGMAVDWEYVVRQRAYYETQFAHAVSEISTRIPPGYDWASNKDLSLYFFGGTIKRKVKVADGLYKNGKPKFKTVEVDETVDAAVPVLRPATTGLSGYYSVDEEMLERIRAEGPIRPAVVAKYVLAARKAQKIATTYYGGLLSLRFPNDRIYPNLNHCQTNTGRLSSSQPNLQNQTDEGDVKRAFISRWGKDGCILELDYSQLEMVWLAGLSGDCTLISDINDGRDMHTELFKDEYGREPTKDERKLFKRRSFALVYGAGATGIAEQAKITLTEAKEFIKTFYTRYSGVKRRHDELKTRANDEGVTFYKEKETGPHKSWQLVMPWGRRYNFVTYHNTWSPTPTFSPTELKNYPVQGSATGDMVPMMLGILQRRLEEAGHWERQDALLINTVHDSVLLDVKKEVLYDVARLCKETLEDAPRYLKQHLGIDFPCKLSVSVEAGPNWQDIEPLEL